MSVKDKVGKAALEGIEALVDQARREGPHTISKEGSEDILIQEIASKKMQEGTPSEIAYDEAERLVTTGVNETQPTTSNLWDRATKDTDSFEGRIPDGTKAATALTGLGAGTAALSGAGEENAALEPLQPESFDTEGGIEEASAGVFGSVVDWITGDDEEEEVEEKPKTKTTVPQPVYDLTEKPKEKEAPKFSSAGQDPNLVQDTKEFNKKFLQAYPTWEPPELKDYKQWTGDDKTLYEKQLEVSEAATKAADRTISQLEEKEANIAQTQLIMKMLDALTLLAAAHMGIESEINTINFDDFLKEKKAFHKDVAKQALRNLEIRKKDKMEALGVQELDRKEHNKLVRQNAIQTYNAGLRRFADEHKNFTSEMNLRYKIGKDKAAANMARSKEELATHRKGLGQRMDEAMSKSRTKRNTFIRRQAMDNYKKFNELIKNAKGDEYTDKDLENYEDTVKAMLKKKQITKKLGKKLLDEDTTASEAMALMNMPTWKTLMLNQFPEENDMFSGAGGTPTAKSGNKTSRRRVNYEGEPHWEYVERDGSTGAVLRTLKYVPIKD